VVVTLTLAVPLPVAKVLGFTAQLVWVAATGSEHDRLTCEEKPLCGVTETALVNMAIWPALMVCGVVPEDEMEKSGGPVTVKFIGAEDVAEGMGLTTESG
jgi:hypothetical protein